MIQIITDREMSHSDYSKCPPRQADPDRELFIEQHAARIARGLVREKSDAVVREMRLAIARDLRDRRRRDARAARSAAGICRRELRLSNRERAALAASLLAAG